MKDPYQILGILPGSDKETIRKAYRKLAQQWHPDMHPPEKQDEAKEKFKEISAAFEAVENPQKSPEFHKSYASSMDDVFAQFFGNTGKRRAISGENINLQCRVTLEEILHGGKRELKYSRFSICKSCNGVGGIETACSQCDGSGFRIIYGAAMTVKAACNKCAGTGKIISSKCSGCNDGFVKGEEQILSFEIHKGVEDEMKFSYRGQGHVSKDPLGIPGNLYVQIVVEPHDKFELLSQGNILFVININYTQLVLGSEINVPTLEGSASLKILPGTHPNQRFRLKELGLPVFSTRTGGIYTRGDQLVEVKLKMPTNIDDKYRKVIDELAQVEGG